MPTVFMEYLQILFMPWIVSPRIVNLRLHVVSQLSSSLGAIDSWQYNSFKLEEVSGGRPLSCLAFFLMKKMDLIKRFHLDETKLAR